MVPVRLTVQNFMSYGDQVAPLDLTGMHTLCLSGENGHGKSALLDAITWSLWGESRAGKNKHDELVRIGADEMSVEFVFEMDSQRYRVLRKRSRRAAGNLWELHQEIGADLWRSLTGNNAAETERALQKLLHMSYDTFINSAYLRQGNADLFVKQSPGKRKEILGDILDLSRYDKLEAKARENCREAGIEVAELERDIRLIDVQLGQENELRAAATALHAQAVELAQTREALKAEWEQIKKRKNELDLQQRLIAGLRTQIASLEREAAELSRDIVEQEAELKKYQALLERQEEICRDYADLEETKLLTEKMELAVANLHQLRHRLNDAEKKWTVARSDIQRQVERADLDYVSACARLQDHASLQGEFAQLVERVQRVGVLEARKKEIQDVVAVTREEFLNLQGRSAALKEKEDQWQSRLDSLAAQQGRCMVCDSPLPPNRIAETRVQYQSELETCKAERIEVWTQAKKIKAEITEHDAKAAALGSEIGELVKDQIRHGFIKDKLAELDSVARDLPKIEDLRAQARKALIAEEFAPELREIIREVEKEITLLSNVEADYASAKQRLAKLTGVERLFADLQNARAAFEAASLRLERVRKSCQERQASRDTLIKQITEVGDCSTEVAGLDRRASEIQVLETARHEKEQLVSREIGRVEDGLARCEGHKAERAVKQGTLMLARTEQEVTDQLAKAFGKKGVQALIIENAIPEIQDEANRILNRLSDGDLSIFFETVREGKAKKDTPIETLDIKVSDNLGTRPLEMYSGGEGFRIAFALRIALSKLLAKRAGARLQTLIIDEGFGTQDGKGREKLVEALHTLREDFEKIIVITHVDELKDAFSPRIEVIKGPGGSQISVYEGSDG